MRGITSFFKCLIISVYFLRFPKKEPDFVKISLDFVKITSEIVGIMSEIIFRKSDGLLNLLNKC